MNRFFIALLSLKLMTLSVIAAPEEGIVLVSSTDEFKDVIEWDQDAGKNISLPEKGAPQVVLVGKVNGRHSLSYQGNPLVLVGDRFTIALQLDRKNNEYLLPIKIDNKSENLYRLRTPWTAEVEVAAPKPSDQTTQPTLKNDWKRFEVDPLFSLDKLGGALFTFGAYWAPRLPLDEKWNLGLGIGLLGLKTAEPRFVPALEYRASLGYRFAESWETELLLGAQTWFTIQAFVPTFGLNFVYHCPDLFPKWPLLKFGKELLVGYSYVAHSSQVHLFRLGVRLGF
jgi:hypothetical protein